MRVQDFIAHQTEQAAKNLLKQAHRIPDEKRPWNPMDLGRSTLNQVQECAFMLGLMPAILESKALPAMGPEFWGEMMKTRESWDTLEKAEAVLTENLAAATAAMRAVSDEDIESEMTFFDGSPWKLYDVMNMQAWNLHYHTGQICYIQTLLGDKEM